MTPQEVIEQIKNFPVSDKIALINQISQSLLTDFIGEKNSQSEIAERNRELSVEERIAIVESLYGSLRAEGQDVPMTREEEREIISEHLSEKYS
jgi:hypothetical protein